MSLIFDSFEDEEDIFQTVKVAPKIVQVTDAERCDPLRKAKVELTSILVAEQVPISAADIRNRMIEMNSCEYNYKAHGFKSLDELLKACNDVVKHHPGVNGPSTYSAFTTDSNKDIKELVENQKTQQQIRSFFNSRSSGRASSHCSVFRNKKGERIATPEEHLKKKKACYARDEEKLKIKSKPMSVERVQDIARFINKNRSELEQISGNTRTIQLIAVQTLFLEKTGLPLWGKVLDEESLNDALNVAEHFPYLKITKKDESFFVETIQFEKIETTNTEREEHPTPSISSNIHQQPANTMSLFEDQHHPIEEACPGFRSESRTKKERPESRLPGTSSSQSTGFAPGSHVFGRQTSANGFGQQIESGTVRDAQEVFVFGSGEQFAEPRKSTTRRSRREVTQKIFGESVVRNEQEVKQDINVLKDYVRERGCVPYLSFSPSDQLAIDNSKWFSVDTESSSETLVELNPLIDNDDDDLDNKYITRSVIEADVRWLAEVQPKTAYATLHNVEICSFVPPRGVLYISQNAEDNVAEMSEHLRKNLGDRVQVKRQLVKTGKAYIYVYKYEDELTYFRVMVMGEGTTEGLGDLRVLFLDLAESHMSSVSYRDLLELPDEFSHKKFVPTIQWAVFTGVNGVKKELQTDLTRLFADNAKTVAVHYPQHPDSIPHVDLIVNTGRSLKFFSEILLSLMRLKISAQDREKFKHYNAKIETLLETVKVYTLFEVSGIAETEEETPIRSRTASVCSTVVPAFETFNVKSGNQTLDDSTTNDLQIDHNERDPIDEMFLKFKDMVMKGDLNSISVYQTIRSMAEEPNSNEVFQQMRDAMKNLIRSEFDNLF